MGKLEYKKKEHSPESELVFFYNKNCLEKYKLLQKLLKRILYHINNKDHLHLKHILLTTLHEIKT